MPTLDLEVDTADRLTPVKGRQRPALGDAGSSFRYLRLVPVLSIVVYLVHIREFYGDRFVFGFFYVLAFGVVYVAWIWVCYYLVARWFAVKAGRDRRPSNMGFRARSFLTGATALSGLFVAQDLCSLAFGGRGAPPRPIGPWPFMVTNATIFLLVSAFGVYRERLSELRTATLEAQYNTLKSQLRPHFLFNALNSLSELIENNEGTIAAAMTQKLSDLYRQILRNSKTRTSTLKSELEIVERYLEIERLRFEERVRFKVIAPSGADEIFLPSLMLQTLVENAVKHGIAPSLDGGEIEVGVEAASGKGYRATITNTGAPYDDGRKSGQYGTGLRNTRERLTLLYGKESDFQIVKTGLRQTAVSFCFSGACLDES